MKKYLIDKGYEIDFTGAHWKMKLPQYAHFTRGILGLLSRIFMRDTADYSFDFEGYDED